MTTTAMRMLLQALALLGLLLGMAGPGHAQTVVYYHTDALGSPVAVTDAGGMVLERREYEPYGKQLTPTLQDGPGYTGHVSDASTELSYMQQRYYDPQIGRFLSVDPVIADGNTGSNFNRYWYANNNPYKFADPDGRLSLDIPAGLIAATDRILRPVSVIAEAALSSRDDKAIDAFSRSIGMGRAALAESGDTSGLLASFGTDHVYRQELPPLIAAAAASQEGNEPMGYRDDSASVPTIVALPRWGELADRSVITGSYHGMTLGRGSDRNLKKAYLHELGHIVDKMNGTRPTDIERSANEFVDQVLGR